MLSKNLKYLRLKNNYSQDYIAKLLNKKSFTTVQKWESGVSEPPLWVVGKLAKLYGESLDTLANINIEKRDNNMFTGQLSSDTFDYAHIPVVGIAADALDNLLIGKRIAASRNAKGLTRKELATLIHVAASTISRYEKGEINKIKLPIIEAIARNLDVNPMWLIGKSKEENTTMETRMECSDFNKLLGNRIRDARKAKNITLLELGKLVGISESTVKRYEDGSIKSVSIDMLKNFAVALNVHPADLMGCSKNMTNLSSEEKDIIEKYRSLAKEGKTAIKATVDSLYNTTIQSKIKDESAR